MPDLVDVPILLFVVGVVALWAAALLGVQARRRWPLDETTREDFSLLLGASLTLLALIIGFTFSMASSRYDQRKMLEEAEANAIGTEYSRLALLPAQDAAKLRPLMKAYIEQRVLFYSERDRARLREINVRTLKLQDELWAAILAPAQASPTPVTALVVSGMNDVLNSQGYTQAAWWNQIPRAAWWLLFTIAVCSNFMVGYGMRSKVITRRLLVILPVFVSIAFAMIADIDSPHRGVIRVVPQNLQTLADQIKGS